MTRPFRFGVSFHTAPSGDDWKAAARKAEDLGFSTFLVSDHLRQGFQPMVALAVAAGATTSIRLGTFVLNNDFRHPVLTAREAATLDLLSGGRFELGIGAGHSGDEYREAGLRFDPAARRVERLGDAVRLIRRLWTGETVTQAGEHYAVTAHRSFPAPAQGRVPIAIGGNGRSLLELAANEADIAGFTGFFAGEDGRARSFRHFTAEGLADRLDILRRAAGPRLPEIELNVLVQAVNTDNPLEAAEAFAGRSRLSVNDVLASPFVLLGSAAEIEDKLSSARELMGLSYVTVFGPAMETMAPVVARLAGR